MKIVLLSFLLTMTGALEWVTNFDMAKEHAARDNKLILVNFSGSDWCAPCIKMKKEVFEHEAFLSLAAERLILVRASIAKKICEVSGYKIEYDYNSILDRSPVLFWIPDEIAQILFQDVRVDHQNYLLSG